MTNPFMKLARKAHDRALKLYTAKMRAGLMTQEAYYRKRDRLFHACQERYNDIWERTKGERP